MDKKKLNNVFKMIEAKGELDYAILDTDNYGDCDTCVNSELTRLYGSNSKGIYAKHWLKGINKGCSFKKLDSICLGHDITEEQFLNIKKIFEEQGYSVLPKEYMPTQVINIKESEV